MAVDGRQVLVGNRRLLADAGIDTGQMERQAEELAEQGKTPMFVAVDGKPGGIMAVADTVKEDSAAARFSGCDDYWGQPANGRGRC